MVEDLNKHYSFRVFYVSKGPFEDDGFIDCFLFFCHEKPYQIDLGGNRCFDVSV